MSMICRRTRSGDKFFTCPLFVPMNKSQVIWLIIRLFGVYLAFLLVVTFIGLVGSIPALFTLPKIDAPNKNANVSNPTMIRPIEIQPSEGIYGANNDPTQPNQPKSADDSITAKFKGENFTTFLWYLIMTAIYGALTWYLIRDGRILFDVLNRERPDWAGAEREPEVTTLNLTEEKRRAE